MTICLWERNGENPVNTKYMYVCHAELNAILNRSSGSLEGAKLYVTLFPCNECAKAIIQSGIKEVVYMCPTNMPMRLTLLRQRKMFDMVGIKYRIYEKNGQKINDRIIKVSLSTKCRQLQKITSFNVIF